MSYDKLSDDELEAKIRRATLERGLSLLTGDDDLPPGQLIALIGKLNIAGDKTEDESKPTAGITGVLETLGGLPAERKQAILDDLQKKLDEARKELPSG